MSDSNTSTRPHWLVEHILGEKMNDYHIAAHKNTCYFDIPRTLGSYECGWWLRGLPPMMYQHYAQSLAI